MQARTSREFNQARLNFTKNHITGILKNSKIERRGCHSLFLLLSKIIYTMVQDGSRILVQDGSRILREMGREMAPRNFDSPPRNRPRNDSAKFCTALREIFTALREICPRNFSKRLSSATLRIRNRLREISGTNLNFEKNSKKVLREIGENLVEFGGGVRCNLADFWRRFQGIIEGTFPASELFIP